MKSRLPVARQVLRFVARRWLYPTFELFWVALFFVARLLLRPSLRDISITGRDRVLVIAPHPDDETLGCGGTMAKHAAAGDQVQVLIVTDGGASRARGLSRPEMTYRRAQEAHRAVRRLNPSLQLSLGALPEGEWDAAELSSVLSQSVHQQSPTIIYAPSCVDFHPEHLAIARSLARVLDDLPTQEIKIRVYELQVPLSLTLINLKVQIKEAHKVKMAALDEYWTQRESFSWHRRQERYLRMMLGSESPVEVFWEMEVSDYTHLMRPNAKPQTNFRSLRPRPFADGLAWLKGIRSRQKLRSIVNHL